MFRYACLHREEQGNRTLFRERLAEVVNASGVANQLALGVVQPVGGPLEFLQEIICRRRDDREPLAAGLEFRRQRERPVPRSGNVRLLFDEARETDSTRPRSRARSSAAKPPKRFRIPARGKSVVPLGFSQWWKA